MTQKTKSILSVLLIIAFIVISYVGYIFNNPDTLLKNSKNFVERQKYDSAITYLKIALYVYKVKNEKGMVLGDLYNDIGDCYKKSGEIAKSIVFFRKSESVYKKNNFAGDQVFRVYANLGDAYMRAGEYYKALEYLDVVFKKQNLPVNIKIDALLSQGWIYKEIGQYEKALSVYELALATVPFQNHYTRGSIYNNIACVYMVESSLQDALSMLNQADEEYATYNPNNKNSEIVLHNKGEIFRLKGDFRNSISYFNQVLQNRLSKNVKGPQLGLSYLSIGQSYSMIGDIRKSDEYLVLADTEYRNSGSFNVNLISVLIYQGENCIQRDEIDKAIAYLMKVEAELGRKNISGHISVLFYQELAYAYHMEGNFLKANEYFKKALNICREKNIIGFNLGTLLVRMSENYVALNDFNQAETCLKEAESIFDKAGVRGLYKGQINLQYAIMNRKKGYYDKAQMNFEAAKLEYDFSEISGFYKGRYYFEYAIMCGFANKKNEARVLHEKAIDEFTKINNQTMKKRCNDEIQKLM